MKQYKIKHQMTINGRRKVFYGDTEKEIRQKIAAFEKEQKKAALFVAVADRWWAEHEPELAVNSRRPYASSLKRLEETWKDLRVDKIDSVAVGSHLENMKKQGYSKHTVKNDLLVANLIFNYAIYHNILKYNPCACVKVPNGLKQTKRGAFTVEDEQKIFAHRHDSIIGFFVFFLFFTGLRPGEALALTVDDIGEIEIRVTKSLYWESTMPKLKETKTEAGTRSVPILPLLKDELKYYFSQFKPQTAVFYGVNGYLLKHEYQRQYEAYKRETGLAGVPYQSRHSFATMLFDADVPARAAQQIIGHAQYSTTMQTYTDISNRRKEKTEAQLFDFVAEEYASKIS